MNKMHSLIITTTDTALVWYPRTSTFHVHDIIDGEVSPMERTVFTHYGDDRGNPPTPEQALSHMLEVLEGNDDHPAWGDDR